MSRRFVLWAWLLLTGGLPAVWVLGVGSTKAEVTKPEAISEAVKTVRTNPPAPGPDDARIAYVVAGLLEHHHFLQHPFDDEFSSKFLDRYLETLDPQHLHFTQEDLAEFERYRTRLDNLTRVGIRRRLTEFLTDFTSAWLSALPMPGHCCRRNSLLSTPMNAWPATVKTPPTRAI